VRALWELSHGSEVLLDTVAHGREVAHRIALNGEEWVWMGPFKAIVLKLVAHGDR
jgi:hypothetical protein